MSLFRVLIVDDHEAVRRNVRALLTARRDLFICGEAADGIEAVEKVKKLRPDLVVMDISMPRMDGVQAGRIIRGQYPESEVIVISQNDPAIVRQQAAEIGARGFVPKIDLWRSLLPMVDDVFAGRSAGTPVPELAKKDAIGRASEAEADANDRDQDLAGTRSHAGILTANDWTFRQMIDNLPAAIYTTDAEGRLTHFNPAAVEFSGRVPEIGTDKWCVSWKIFAADGTPMPLDQCPMAIALREGRVEEGGEFIAERPDGTRVWFTPYPRPVRDPQNRIIGGINMLMDITERKQAEQALLESHTLRETAMEAGRLGAWEWEVEQNKVTWTERVYEVHGLKPGEFEGTVEGFAKLVHPDDRQRVQGAIEQSLAGKAPYKLEFRIVRPSGEVRWLFTRANVIRNTKGAPVRMIGITHDITDRKHAEQALRESEERFRAIVDTTPECVKLVASDGTLLHMNASGLAMVGAGFAEDVVGKSVYDLIVPEYRDKFRSFNERICRGEKGTLEFEILGVRGERRYMETHAAPMQTPDGSVAQLAVTRDITKRKQANQANAWLAAIVDSSDDAIVSKNLDSVITSWNRGAERLFGYTAQEAVGRHISLIIPVDRRQEEIGIIERLKRGERVDHFETVRVHKNGSLLDISLTISPVKDDSGLVVGASKVARDITERKRAEKALASGERQQRALFQFADRLQRAQSFDDVYNASLDAMRSALLCDRAAILLCDDGGVMRFVNSRGLSDNYRKVTEGHSPWKPDESNPTPVCINDLSKADFGSLQPTIQAEGIGSLAFVPLVSHDKLIGKFMAYFDTPHVFSDDEIELSITIARQLAFGIERKRGEEALRHSEERFRNLAKTLDAEVRARTKELEQRNTDVLRQSEQLRSLSQRQIQIQDEERRHIARELHDSVGQTLTVLGLNLAQVAQDANRQASALAKDVEESCQVVQQLSQEIRTMSYLLHPPLLDESGLPVALSWYIRGLEERSGLEIALTIAEDFGRLPRDTELAIFRLIQESLTNIHRHSGSKSAVIRITRDPENLTVEIQDRGKGMSPDRLTEIRSQGSGVGIRGMQERVLQFRGKMEIESDASGTKILVTLPILDGFPPQQRNTVRTVQPVV